MNDREIPAITAEIALTDDMHKLLNQIKLWGKKVQMKSVKHLIEMTKKQTSEFGTQTEPGELETLTEQNQALRNKLKEIEDLQKF